MNFDEEDNKRRNNCGTYIHKGAYESGHTPQHHPHGHDPLPTVPIAKVSEQRREDHVTQYEAGLQEATHVVGDAIEILDLFENTYGGENDHLV